MPEKSKLKDKAKDGWSKKQTKRREAYTERVLNISDLLAKDFEDWKASKGRYKKEFK